MKECLENRIGIRSRNLQGMKFLAAILVICSHAYPIVTGNMLKEPLYRVTHGQLSLGGLAVGVFFLAAGFFIAASVEKKATATAYFGARCKRIFPLLWLVVFLSILWGAFITSCSLKEYMTNPQTWSYALNGLLIPVHNLPGVFEHVAYLPTVNGALWTLPVEFLCYIGCFLSYKWKLLREDRFAICMVPIAVAAIMLLFVQGKYPFLMQTGRPVILFAIGMGFWVFRKKITLSLRFFIPLFVIFFLMLFVNMANLAMFLIFPYLCMFIWFYAKQIPEVISRMGDLSYGIYLCGFPIQQSIVYFGGSSIGIGTNMAVAVVISFVLGILFTKIEKVI